MSEDKSPSLEDLILATAPPKARMRYLSLVSRVRTRSFGPLEEDIVILDTETTGLSFRDSELIEISAARISGRGISDRFETFVRPTNPIPEQIVELTGITNADVRGAPKPHEAVCALAEFVAGSPVVAHNAVFDRTFVESVPGGAGVSDLWIDSLSLSRMALPLLASHRLSDMAAAFGCARVTHRSCDDVDALVGLWPILLLALCDMPRGLLSHLATMHPDVDWPFRIILKTLADEVGAAPSFSLVDARTALVDGAATGARPDAMTIPTLVAPDAHNLAREFERGGIVSRMYPNMEHREEQVVMARRVAEALAAPTHLSVEAGTGVGKSIAYLLPEALFAQHNHITVGVATKTNALTDQLVSHELPALAKALPEGLVYTSLKGYEHYPCLRKLELAADEDLPIEAVSHDGRSDNSVAADQLTAIAVTYAFVCQAPEGDLDTLGIRWRYVPRALLTSTHGECLRNRCPFYPNKCLLHGARRRAAAADIVVTNHSLLLTDVAADGRILPPIRHWVVDEAHSFESEARRQWAQEVSSEVSRAAFERLGGTKSGVIHRLLVESAGLDAHTLAQGLVAHAAADVSRASVACADLFETVHELLSLARDDAGYDMVTLWIGREVRESQQWAALDDAAGRAQDALDQAVRTLAEAAQAVSEEAPGPASELADATRELKDLSESIRLIVSGTDDDYVFSAQLSRSKRHIASERLVAEKVDVGADLAQRWLPEMRSVVFTSATIAVGNDFSHFEDSVGLSALARDKRPNLKLTSSFDFDANMGVLVAQDIPVPNDRAYPAALESLLFDVHVAMGGSVLTLFTNRREMERAYHKLKPRLATCGLDLACQERGSSPRRLRQRFVEEESLSLFALRSFWEGFDATGDTLRCVVIPKLPFASPNDPLVRERELREGKSSWWKHSLPEAVLSLKQAAGRLIRSSTDTGILVLADSRLTTMRYGRTFIASLPSRSIERVDASEISSRIKAWRLIH